MKLCILIFVVALTASTAFAHSGVKNMAMKALGETCKSCHSAYRE